MSRNWGSRTSSLVTGLFVAALEEKIAIVLNEPMIPSAPIAVFRIPNTLTAVDRGMIVILNRPSAYNSGGLARGSRSLAVAVLGRVTKGPPSSDAAFVKATSGISLARPSSGNSFRNGKNG